MKTLKRLSLLIISLSLFACSAQTTTNSAVIEPQSLQNTWQLTSIDGQAINSAIDSTLSMDSEHKATGKLACNNFFGTVVLNDSHLKIEKMGSTRMFCEEQANKIEMIVSQVLNDGAEMQLTEDKLSLAGKEHTLTYTLKK